MSAPQWSDRAALTVLALGALLMIQPWWKSGFQVGFFVTLVGLILQTITGQWLRRCPVAPRKPASKP